MSKYKYIESGLHKLRLEVGTRPLSLVVALVSLVFNPTSIFSINFKIK